jgi:two-component system, NarL family, response regulator NreC
MSEMEPYRIVLADDHVLIRQGLRRLIEDVADLEVIGEAGDGLELLSHLSTLVPDMVILDISMPNLRGIEIIGRLRMRSPDVKVLILSMHREYLHQAVSAGADGYLLKEDADRDLFSAIDTIRRGKIYLSPSFSADLVRGKAGLAKLLSAREKEVLKLIAKGKTNKDIAETLFISVRTVESHRASIIDKTRAKNTADLVRYAIEKGFV